MGKIRSQNRSYSGDNRRGTPASDSYHSRDETRNHRKSSFNNISDVELAAAAENNKPNIFTRLRRGPTQTKPYEPPENSTTNEKQSIFERIKLRDGLTPLIPKEVPTVIPRMKINVDMTSSNPQSQMDLTNAQNQTGYSPKIESKTDHSNAEFAEKSKSSIPHELPPAQNFNTKSSLVSIPSLTISILNDKAIDDSKNGLTLVQPHMSSSLNDITAKQIDYNKAVPQRVENIINIPASLTKMNGPLKTGPEKETVVNTIQANTSSLVQRGRGFENHSATTQTSSHHALNPIEKTISKAPIKMKLTSRFSRMHQIS